MTSLNKDLIPEQAKLISRVLHEAGYQAYLVGGCVRDGIIGEEPNDYDFCTNANASQVVDVLKANDIKYNDEFSFINYTIATVNEMDIDISKFHGDTIEEDLRKRDLTINAIAYDIESDSFVDVCGGIEDIENRIVRIIDKDYLLESPQVTLKAMRFSLQYGFRIDDESYAAMLKHLPALRNIKTSQVEKIIGKTLKCCRASFMGKEQ